MQVAHDVREVLARATCEGVTVRLPLDVDPARPGLGERTARVLTAAGAPFSHRRGAFVFADLFPFGQAQPLIDYMIVNRKTAPRPYRGEAPCPPAVAEQMCDELALRPGWTVLEPSAGHGNLAAEAADRDCAVDCIELEHHRARDIKEAGLARRVITADFLTLPQQPRYDAVIMYPPFRRDLAAAHLVHAHGFLRPGGQLGALVSLGLENGVRKASVALRELLQQHGSRRYALEGEVMSPSGRPLNTELWIIYGPQH
ncbi:SAM-dependent methyltransferase [Streptomyces sp. NPDC059506]|uniref:SAM-dependent methyltransferase n=1 Tax=Streptomyces sp. NPDC059506 TaxID=3347751 RepID=UPI0036B3AE85